MNTADEREALARRLRSVGNAIGNPLHRSLMTERGLVDAADLIDEAADALESGFRRQGPLTDARVEFICEVMHDAYEDAAAREGWTTQEASRKPWADVPAANKRTMRFAVRAALEAAREVS